MHSGIIKHRCVFRVLLCFETTVNSSTLFQTCLYHSRGTRAKWKGHWVDNLKTPLLPCSLLSPDFYPSVHGDCSVTCPELHSRGKGKSLETSKSRIISTLPRRPGALPERAKNVLSHCHAQVFETPWTVASQAPLSMGILQAGMLEWVAMPSSRGSSRPRERTQVSRIAGGFFTPEPQAKL